VNTLSTYFSKKTHSILSFAGFCAITWSVLTLGLAITIQSINRNQAITLDLTKLFWWSQIELALSSPTTESLTVSLGAAPTVFKKLPAIKRTKKLRREVITLKPTVPEKDILLSMHLALRSRFFVALSTQKTKTTPPKALSTLDDPPFEQQAKPLLLASNSASNPIPILAINNLPKPPKNLDTQENEYSKTWKIVSAAPQKKSDIIIKKIEYPNPQQPNHQKEDEKLKEATPQKCNNSLLPQGYLCSIDAFSAWDNPFGAQAEVLSHEGSAKMSSQAKWIQTKKDHYWNTVILKSLDEDSDPIPMLSSNTAKLLEKWSGVSLQRSAGILLGEVPSGWSVELSNRAEAPIYLDEKRQLVSSPFSSTPLSGGHSFAFLNAAPGIQLLSLKTSTGESGPVIALPLLEGTVTYVKIASTEKKTISGIVLDASHTGLKGLARMQVRIIGQETKSTLTHPDGSFQITEVSTAGIYPLYLEIEGRGGFTHRYRMAPTNIRESKPLSFFRFNPVQIQRWVGQLSNEISEESALAVSALPTLVTENEALGLYPSVNTLSSQSTLLPKTFGLNKEDWLLTHSPMKKNSPRFISIQIPYGPNICKVEDKENNTLWSELLFSSPRVINVIGPD
jgi:hypothetical protein